MSSIDDISVKYLQVYSQLAYSFVIANTIEALEHILLSILVYSIVCLAVYKILFSAKRQRSSRFPVNLVNNVKFPKHKRILFVTSHPDDECMFFGPTILCMSRREDCQIYLLCLSNGNYEEKANLRRQELFDACITLGIPSSNITIINASALQDDPNKEWKVDSIAKFIVRKVECLDIEAIVTFDREGVSHHPNHCAVYYATASLRLTSLLPSECKIYTLDSISLLRKYTSIFDLLCTFAMSTNWCIINWKDSNLIRTAMKKHVSQLKWFRRLYILFSRYMIINSLREINLSDIELEMQLRDDL